MPHALAQVDNAGAVPRGGAASKADAAQPQGVPKLANRTDSQDNEPTRDVPVNERSFGEGTVALSADHLFGTWFGRLPTWEESGFKPTLTWLTNFGGNPVGGRSQGFTECDNLGLDLLFDLEKCGACATPTFTSPCRRDPATV